MKVAFLEQKTIEEAKKIDSLFSDMNKSGVKRGKMAEAFASRYRGGCKIVSSYHKTVVITATLAIGFCASDEIRRQKQVQKRIGQNYVPTHYWGKNAMVQSRCDLDAVNKKEWMETKAMARSRGVIDIHKGNLGKIGNKVFIFDGKASSNK
jgi:hypothetical protein